MFGIISLAVSSLVENYMIQQRIESLRKEVSNIAVQIAPFLEQNDAVEMYGIVTKSGNDIGGRMLVLNGSGITQVDSFSEYNGVKLDIEEVNDVIYDKNSASYGMHDIYDESTESYFETLYYTSAVMSGGNTIGAVLYSSDISDVMAATAKLGQQMLWVYLVASVGVFLSSIILTRFIITPIQQLTNVAMKISSGDLGSRTEVKGKSELAELGQTFNMMCDRLQNIDKQRSEFVSDASHELKTPLASMKILVESLLYQDHVEENVYKEFLTDINGEIDRLNGLITDLLLLSKMDSDILSINVEKASLTSLVKKCVNALRPIAQKKHIEVEVQQADEIELECDPLKLRQAINNLVENAIKYSVDGGHVKIAIRKLGQEAYVRIEDDGVGMKEEHLAHIFERFYRVDKARARETGGTGLGLHIVRRIALMHGGRVDVESKEGSGSIFTLVLPLTQDNRAEVLHEEE